MLDLKKAEAIFNLLEDDSQDLLVPDVVLPELEYVLSSDFYQASRKEICDAFLFLRSLKNIIFNSPETCVAIDFFCSCKLDMADCLVAAYSLKHDIASFDKSLLKVVGKSSVL